MNKRRYSNRCFLFAQKCLTFFVLVILSFSSVPFSTLFKNTASAAGDVLTQTHYHFRNDDGSETLATSLTGGNEDLQVSDLDRDTPLRVRLSVSNEGTVVSSSTSFMLQYGTKITTCSDIAVWVEVGSTNAAWDMYDSSYITDGTNTTNINEANGGVTDENTTFVASNAALKDTSSTIAAVALDTDEFLEGEFSIVQTVQAAFGTTYCFRLSRSGAPLDTYTTYPEVSTASERDFKVQRGSLVVSGTSGTITAGSDYVAPASSSTAFIRITNSNHTGAGKDSAGGTQPADDVTVAISNPENIATSVTFTRPSTATNNTYVTWEIVEFVGLSGSDNELIVKDQGTVTYGTTALTATGSAVASITDDTDVVVFITGQQNPDTLTSDYNTGISTAHWDASSNEPVFTRGEAGGDAVIVSYAVVEFTGANWNIQRAEHTYTSSGVTETESIAPVNSLSRSFLHTQKRSGTGLTGTDEFGHEVWLSSIGAVSFSLLAGASTPSDQTSVAWIIENTQTAAGAMIVTRSNGNTIGGSEPLVQSVAIGKELSDITRSSIFANSTGAGLGTTYPRPIAGFMIASSTHYEIWRSDTGTQLDYRAEVVEWPNAQLSLSQNDYRFYTDNDALDPTDPWPSGATDLGENTVITEFDGPLQNQELIRIRMSLLVENASMPQYAKSFKLQYGQRVSTCSAIGEESWADVGALGSGAIWRGFNGTSTADSTALAGEPPSGGDLNLTVSDTAGTYEESNSSAINPYSVAQGDDIEYDWLIQQNDAPAGTFYCFRMVEHNGALLSSYIDYPQLRTASFTPRSQNWRFYDDAENSTPSTALAAETSAPTDIAVNDALKLRVTVKELSNMAQNNARFSLQFSEDGTFATSSDVLATTSCTGTAVWCYFDGGGSDNAVIQQTLLSDADACTSGVGNGCGTHTESPSVLSGFTHENLAAVEYEFTIVPHAPRVNTVYYFRLYDTQADAPVETNTGETYPSLATEGASLVFTISGLSAGTSTEGIVVDATSTANSILFGSLPFGTEYEAAQRLVIDTNATEGYQVLLLSDQDLQSSTGASISPISSSNATPGSWGASCSALQSGCFGYHVGDDLLAGGSARFGADDSFSALSTSSEEVMYSSIPTVESHDIVYRIRVEEEQEAGSYEAHITYIAIPVF